MSEDSRPIIGIIGGTGDLGGALAKCWAAAGYPVIVGSRSRDRAEAFAVSAGVGMRGMENALAAAAAEVIVVAVPYASHEATLLEIRDAAQGKVVVDAVVPLVPPKVSVVSLPEEGSAAQIAARLLGEGVRVTSAFHNVGAKKLAPGQQADCDVLVFGDDREARDLVIGLAGAVVARGIDGGALANSAAAEALTSVLIAINRRYRVNGAGIKITTIE